MSSSAGCTCGAPLAADQRYCLACGAATAEALTARAALGAALARPVAPALAQREVARFRLAISAHHAAELPLRAATLAFALVLGSTAWAAAQIVSPAGGFATTTVAVASAAAPAGTPPPPVPPTTDSGAVAGATADSLPPSADSDLEPPVSTDDPVATPAAAAAGDEGPADAGPADDDSPTTGDGEPTDGATPTTPPLKRVVVLSLPPLPYEAMADPAGPAPYLSGDLAGKGALLRAFHGTAPSTLASNAALLSGQAPNAATLAGCPVVADVAPGTIGDDDQAAGEGCRFSTDVFTVGDLLASTDRTWRTYAEDAAGATCTPPVAGEPYPASMPASLAFRTFSDDPTCATRIAAASRLSGDLAATASAPAFSYVEVRGCQEDGTACRPGDPAAVDASLRRIVPALLKAPAYDDATAIIVLPAHAATAADGTTDQAGCCTDRPWAQTDGAGGGRTGALVLSPLVRPGSVIDGAVDHLDALKTIALALDVRVPGYAARTEVKGLPRETWERWEPAGTASE